MKKVPYSLLSGIMAIVLLLSPFANSVTFAAEGSDGENVRAYNYDVADYYEGYDDGFFYGEEDGYYDGYYEGERFPDADGYLEGDEEPGYKLGFKDGYETGYELGYLEGLEEDEDNSYDAYEEGYNDGAWDGYYQGHDDGFDGKKKDNSFTLDEDADEEYNKGYADGYPEGYAEGYVDGQEDRIEWDNRTGVFETKDPVTGDVYYDYDLDEKTVEYFKEKGGSVKTKKTRSVSLDKDAIKAIKDYAVFESINGTLIKFPKKALEQILNSGEYKEEVDFYFNEVTPKDEDNLSEAIQFYILNGDYDYFKDKLDTPITVTFKVDPKKVKNWADLTLIYVDDEGDETNYANQVLSINPETGEVVVEIYHFSTYYIAEVAGKGAGEDKVLKPGQGGPGNGGNGGGTPNGQGGIGNGGNGEGTTNGQGGPSEPTVKATAIAGDADSQTLPNTATNTYNLLLAGALTLALGLGAVVLYRRKKAL